MPSIVSRYATPLITGLFLVSLISGVALFFHFGTAIFHSMHEWLSMILIIPFVAHIWKNWRAFLTYFKRWPMTIALVLSVVASIPFAVPLSGAGGNPLMSAVGAIQNGSLANVSPLYGQTPKEMMADLQKKGWTITSADQSMLEIATANGKSERDVMVYLAGIRR